ncbi:hypothetical protein D6783_01605 [Candidatus Woesearchaeota archaeon]|nr:MAG: hypothetical protein D6783_01605 [Candidatus Woesearchaeota archaeon]
MEHHHQKNTTGAHKQKKNKETRKEQHKEATRQAKDNNKRTLTIIQFLFEVIVAGGFLLGLIPFAYLFSVWFVIPLTITNLILSIITKNDTFNYTLPNVFLAFFSLMPILGIAARIAGVIFAALSAATLSKQF